MPNREAGREDCSAFLPVDQESMKQRGWNTCDFIIVTGDAYVDHPSFGAALIGRILEAEGFRVGILAQPRWHTAEDFMRLGRPRLAYMITSGNLDSDPKYFVARDASPVTMINVS